MSKNITVSDELYARLKEQASLQAQTVETYLDHLTAPCAEHNEPEALRERLRAKGLLVTWPNPPSVIEDHPPVVVRGVPLSQIIIEDRRSWRLTTLTPAL
jgi:hypothetical protein